MGALKCVCCGDGGDGSFAVAVEEDGQARHGDRNVCVVMLLGQRRDLLAALRRLRGADLVRRDARVLEAARAEADRVLALYPLYPPDGSASAPPG